MFLCHFPSGHPAWALPSALPVGARTFLPEQVQGGHPAYWVFFDYIRTMVAHCLDAEPGSGGTGSSTQSVSELLVGRAVEGEVGELVGSFVLRTRHMHHIERIEPPPQLDQPVEERLQPRVPDLVAKLQLPDD